jgi:hypothetical protein
MVPGSSLGTPLSSIGMDEPDTRIVLFVYEAAGDPRNPMVDHPEQPADYVHPDGTTWTWQGRWRPLGGGRHLRVYDLLPETPGQPAPAAPDLAP